MALIFVLAFGLIIGSFLNVCIYRLPLGESLAWPASHCPSCRTPIKPYDNIPVISYLLLMEKDSAIPAVIVRGHKYEPFDGSAKVLIRPAEAVLRVAERLEPLRIVRRIREQFFLHELGLPEIRHGLLGRLEFIDNPPDAK